MLSLPASVRVHLAVEPCDMRRGFDSLAAIVREHFGDDPLSGHLFVFRSRRADRIKILWWDRDGFVIWMKRLERGAFRAAARDATLGAARVELTRRELAMMLEGIDERNTAKSRRFACTAAQRVYV
jgi:transposase